MSQPLAHLYDLALRALDEQERRVDALRGRLAPVLAAAALGTSLLSGPVVGGARPAGIAGTLALGLALIGLVGTLATAGYVLGRRQRTSFDPDLRRLTIAFRQAGMLDDIVVFYDAMIIHLGRRRDRTTSAVDQLEMAFTWMLCSILLMLCGLALGTLVG